jgi:hypothetical protein
MPREEKVASEAGQAPTRHMQGEGELGARASGGRFQALSTVKLIKIEADPPGILGTKSKHVTFRRFELKTK